MKKLRSNLISIIIPVYNVKEYVTRCIDSVLKQTYSNLEVLIIDDGSTDGSAEICDRLAESDTRIKVFHKENIYEVKSDQVMNDEEAAKIAEQEIIRIAHLPD